MERVDNWRETSYGFSGLSEPDMEMITYSVSQRGSVLASRETGREIREEVERLVVSAPKESVVQLDFQGVLAVSPSCADEFVGRLYSNASAGEFGDRVMVLTHLSNDHRDIMDPILKRRGAIAAELEGGSVRLLNGGAGGHLEETLEVASKLGRFRATDLAQHLKLSVPATDNRLSRLWKNQLLRRESVAATHGGREYVYSTVL